VQAPTKYGTVITLKTAKALRPIGILLQRADEVMLFAAPRRSISTPSDI